MSFSKIMKYSALGVGFIVIGEIYYVCVKFIREKLRLQDELEELNEAICTRSEINYNSKLTRQIQFRRIPTLHVTEILENLILSAQKTIHVAMYIFTNQILADALKEAYRKGVKICIIVDHSMKDSSNTQTDTLKAEGIHVKIYSINTLHHKFCLIDVPNTNEIFSSAKGAIENDNLSQIFVPKNGILINGSLNWTVDGFTSNCENIIVTSNAEIIAQYTNEFIKRWQQSIDL